MNVIHPFYLPACPSRQDRGRGHHIHRLLSGGVLVALCAALLHIPSVRAEGYPGFGLNLSRVVVMADAKGGTTAVALNNSDNVYLVQSRVYPADGLTGFPAALNAPGTRTPPFLVTPPLRRLGPQSRLPLRIMVTPDNGLPQDRESLFFLSAKAIPSVPPPDKTREKTASPRVILALQQYVKLYYRPAGLKPHAIYDGDVAPKLSVSLSGGMLQVTNPTPYHIAFGLLTVNGKPVEQKVLRLLTPPEGTQRYPLPAGTGHPGDKVVWQVIDEFGLVTAKQTQTLH